jgi:two-component system, OmpR family, sensor histidine kinase ResE
MLWREKKEKIQKWDNEEGFYKSLINKESSIINYLSDGLLVFDKYNNLLIINPKAEELLEVKKEEVVDIQFLGLFKFKGFNPILSLLGGAIRRVDREELEMAEGFFIEVTSIPMENENGKIGTMIVLHDISREKTLERMKDDFVTVSAHKLRTPTSIVKWSLGMLLAGDFGELNQKQRETTEKAYSSNDRMITLINDLLTAAKTEEGRYISKIELSDMASIIESVVNVYIDITEKKKIKLEFRKPQIPLPGIMIDRQRIEMAMENLLDNAVRYTLSGGEILVEASFSEENKQIEISIKDTGVGIPKDQQDMIFSKFFRGENALKIETEGTGIGLFISKNIIEAHGGKIWFKSEEGKGTTFYFILPVKKEFGEFLTEKFY